MTADVKSAEDVAQWMLAELESGGGYLEQEWAAGGISDRFGEAFTYDNDNGNLAIRRDVLDAFRRLTGDAVVWVRSERAWRRRDPSDPPGRQSD